MPADERAHAAAQDRQRNLIHAFAMSDDQAIAKAKNLLTQHGYVVLKAGSYRQAQERQRVAEALRKSAEEDAAHTRAWAETTLHNEIRDLMARCTFLYGAARARGSTVEDLAGGWTVVGTNLPTERATTVKCHCGAVVYIIQLQRHDMQFICLEHGRLSANQLQPRGIS